MVAPVALKGNWCGNSIASCFDFEGETDYYLPGPERAAYVYMLAFPPPIQPYRAHLLCVSVFMSFFAFTFPWCGLF